MKKLVFFAFLLSLNAFAQTIVRKDGSKVSFDDLIVSTSKKKVLFKSNAKEDQIAFADFDSAVVENKILKRFDLGKKPKVYYVLAASKGKTLGVVSAKRVKDRGGFGSVITLYEIAVIENGKILEELKFTQSKSDSETKKRSEFGELVSKYFGDCMPLQAKLQLFINDSDPYNLTLLNWLDNPEKVNCK